MSLETHDTRINLMKSVYFLPDSIWELELLGVSSYEKDEGLFRRIL